MASKKQLPKGKKAGSGSSIKAAPVKVKGKVTAKKVDERAMARKTAKPRSSRQDNHGS